MPFLRRFNNQLCKGFQLSDSFSLPLLHKDERLSKISRLIPSRWGSSHSCPEGVQRSGIPTSWTSGVIIFKLPTSSNSFSELATILDNLVCKVLAGISPSTNKTL